MTTDLEQRLREALHEDAERARLVNPSGPPAPEARPLTVDRHRRPSARRLVAVAAAIALIAAAGVAVIQDRDQGHDVDTTARAITDIKPGSTVELPPAPLSPRGIPALVWTGSELIVWGGSSDDIGRSLGDGAAFDLAAGTWRVLAPAPIEPRILANVAWTGTEMLVVGGYPRSSTAETGTINFLRDGGAYNPSTDTWRRLPEAPYDVPDAWGPVWTGNELIIVSIEGDGPKAAAYSPETNEWRTIADPPGYVPASLIWAGEALLKAGSSLARYDPQADEWQTVDEEGYAYLAAVRDPDGEVREVLALPTETGAPVTVLDRVGNVTGSLPGPPGELADLGGAIADGAGLYTDQGTWVGEEVLFWILGPDSQVSSRQTAQPWALNPETGTWRSVGAGTPPLGAHLELAASAGILIGWGSLNSNGFHPTGIAYRPPELRDVLQPVEDRLGLPEPGEQPADPGAAEAQVRAAYVGIFDASQPREDRAPLSERPEVWLPANQALSEGQYGAAVQDLQAEVDEVVFATPTQASVRFQLVASDGQVPQGYQIGEAVLVDGRWRVAITTTCEQVSIAGVQCNLSL